MKKPIFLTTPRLTKTVYNIGYWDYLKPNGCKEYYTWKTILSRCYNKNDKSYCRYGAIGVSVCKNWHSFSNFYNDISKIEGWNEKLYYQGLLQIDKDKKQLNISKKEKIYSKDTCCFMSSQKNNKYKNYNSIQKECIAITPNSEILFFNNQTEFCKAYSIDIYTMWHLLNHKDYSNNGWSFYYKDEWNNMNINKQNEIKNNRIHPHMKNRYRKFKAISPDNKEYYSENVHQFCIDNNLDNGNVSKCLNNKKDLYKNWKFYWL